MTSNNLYKEKELFQFIAQGNETAFADFYLLVKTDSSAYACKVLGTREAAQEVIQESLIRLWLHRDKLVDVVNPRAYFHRIVANECFRYLSKHGFREYDEPSRLQPGSAPYQTESIISYRETARIIAEEVASLPPKRRQIYRLSREEGLTQHEIAEQLGASRDYVKKALAICLQVIRKRLTKEGIFIPAFVFGFF